MKYIGETSCVIGIEIYKDRTQRLLGLSRKGYIGKVLERFRMKDSVPTTTPFFKGDKFNLSQCLQNELEWEQMKIIPYAQFLEA